MYKVIGLLFVFFLVQKEEVITWKASDKLDWNNFKGAPIYNTDAVAITASGITYGYSATMSEQELKEYTAQVTAQFYPQNSWYLKERVNDTILGHEQLHFDITELHARKLRMAIANFKFTKNIKQEMARIYEQINVELKEMQDAYDSVSDFSRDYEGQKKWEAFIAKELLKYKDYKEHKNYE